MGAAALSWGWLTGPLSTSILALVGTGAAVISTWAAIASKRAARRGLYVSTRSEPAWDYQPAGQRPGADPYRMTVKFTLRGDTAIRSGDFDQGKDLVFDVGADIIEKLGCRTDPRQETKPEFNVQGTRLSMHPALINPGTIVYLSLLTGQAPAKLIECTDAVLANVHVQSVDDSGTRPRAYWASVPGGLLLLAAFGVPHVAHTLAGAVFYKVAVILVCLIAFAVIVVARITKPRLALALSAIVLLGLAASVARETVGLASTVAPRRPVAAQGERCSSSGGGDWVTRFHAGPKDNETVGYSSNSEHVFVNPIFPHEDQAQKTQDQRVERDEQMIFAMNAQADCRYQQDHAAGGSRPMVELAYFAGLTEGVDEDYDSGEAEELEGLLAAQRASLNGTGPLLKIVVANGGSKMLDAVQVAGKLVALAREDHTLLGVVGMDRSTTAVQTAIQLFARNKIPVVATTLSADGIGNGSSPYYYELAPPNSSEATMIRQYIWLVVHAYFEQVATKYPSGGSPVATRIVIEEPNRKPDDLYIHTLVYDLTTEAWHHPFHLPQPQVIYTPGKALCGDSVVDIYAGRHDKPVTGAPYNNDFSGFLSYIATSCKGPQPFIIADDGVTRFVADPEARGQSTYKLWISYVTKGIAILRTGTACLHEQSAATYSGPFGDFCREYAHIVTALRAQVKGLNFLWTGERVGLAYDAAKLFLTAVSRGGPLTHLQIPHQFQQDGEVQGITGAVNFAVSNIGENQGSGMPMAIVRLDLSNATTTPTCAFPGQTGYLYGPGPGHGSCPNNQG